MKAYLLATVCVVFGAMGEAEGREWSHESNETDSLTVSHWPLLTELYEQEVDSWVLDRVSWAGARWARSSSIHGSVTVSTAALFSERTLNTNRRTAVFRRRSH